MFNKNYLETFISELRYLLTEARQKVIGSFEYNGLEKDDFIVHFFLTQLFDLFLFNNDFLKEPCWFINTFRFYSNVLKKEFDLTPTEIEYISKPKLYRKNVDLCNDRLFVLIQSILLSLNNTNYQMDVSAVYLVLRDSYSFLEEHILNFKKKYYPNKSLINFYIAENLGIQNPYSHIEKICTKLIDKINEVTECPIINIENKVYTIANNYFAEEIFKEGVVLKCNITNLEHYFDSFYETVEKDVSLFIKFELKENVNFKLFSAYLDFFSMKNVLTLNNDETKRQFKESIRKQFNIGSKNDFIVNLMDCSWDENESYLEISRNLIFYYVYIDERFPDKLKQKELILIAMLFTIIGSYAVNFDSLQNENEYNIYYFFTLCIGLTCKYENEYLDFGSILNGDIYSEISYLYGACIAANICISYNFDKKFNPIPIYEQREIILKHIQDISTGCMRLEYLKFKEEMYKNENNFNAMFDVFKNLSNQYIDFVENDININKK